MSIGCRHSQKWLSISMSWFVASSEGFKNLSVLWKLMTTCESISRAIYSRHELVVMITSKGRTLLIMFSSG
jgi:hypothetical protein